jgi:hypothetical protein
MLFKARIKHTRRGVEIFLHDVTPQATPAATQERAEQSARLWCGAEPGRQFISTEPAVVFDDGNVPQAAAAPLAGPGNATHGAAAAATGARPGAGGGGGARGAKTI